MTMVRLTPGLETSCRARAAEPRPPEKRTTFRGLAGRSSSPFTSATPAIMTLALRRRPGERETVVRRIAHRGWYFRRPKYTPSLIYLIEIQPGRVNARPRTTCNRSFPLEKASVVTGLARRRGRPRKFLAPSRAITLTLPEHVIDALQRRRCRPESRRRSPDAAGTGEAAARAGGARTLRPARGHRRQPDAHARAAHRHHARATARRPGPHFVRAAADHRRPRADDLGLDRRFAALARRSSNLSGDRRNPARGAAVPRTSPCTSAASSCSNRGASSGAAAAAGRKSRIPAKAST